MEPESALADSGSLIRKGSNVKDELKRMGIRSAVVELRVRMDVGQETLAGELARIRRHATPNRDSISWWERGKGIPSPAYRAALAQIAQDHGYTDLAMVFRGDVDAWSFAGCLFPLILKDISRNAAAFTRPAREAKPDATMLCDFCSSPAPAWSYPAASFIDLMGSHSIGDWIACEDCHALIEADDRDGLARRAVAALADKVDPEWSLAYCRDLHRRFRAHRTGPAERLSA
jgi:hypothetical protein